ncbi:MAG: zinc-ribbon domain-containing protein [Caldicoprobacterales bacterium]
MFCGNCGSSLQDGAKFCGSCGAKVEAAAPANEAQPEATAGSFRSAPGYGG